MFSCSKSWVILSHRNSIKLRFVFFNLTFISFTQRTVELFMSQYVFGQYKGSSSVHAFDLMVDRVQAFISFLEYHGNWILEREVGENSEE